MLRLRIDGLMLRAFAFVVCLAVLLGAGCSSGFQITEVATSTGKGFIEPALGDNVRIAWTNPSRTETVEALVIFQDDKHGSAVDDASGSHYSVVATVPLSGGGTSGTLVWPAKDTPPEQVPVGTARVGIKYKTGRIQITKHHFTISPTVCGSRISFAAGAGEKGISVSYSLSAAVRKCSVWVAGQEIKGTTHAGENVLPKAWDGRDRDGDPVDLSDEVPVTVTTVPAAGPGLRISDIELWKVKGGSRVKSTDGSFSPEDGEKLEIRYRISEPVRRPQATKALTSADIYHDSRWIPEPVRILACDRSDRIDNDPDDGRNPGRNKLAWDGKQESGVVSVGPYKITLFAYDDAGIGCESETFRIKASVKPGRRQKRPVLVAVTTTAEIGDRMADVIYGQVAEGWQVQWSKRAGGKTVQTVKVHPRKGGLFEFEVKRAPGRCTWVLTAVKPGQKPVRKTVELFTNEFACDVDIDPGTATAAKVDRMNRFHPSKGEKLAIRFTSQADDRVEAEVERLSPTHWPVLDDPIPPAIYLNGYSFERAVRRLWSDRLIRRGSNTLRWDGRDDGGRLVPPGVYRIHVWDKPPIAEEFVDSTTELTTLAVVDSGGSGPAISTIRTDRNEYGSTISWMTNTPTVGWVILENSEAGETHVVVPSVEPSRRHCVRPSRSVKLSFWIVAEDADGRRSVSGVQAVDVRPVRDMWAGLAPSGRVAAQARALSATKAEISWNTRKPVIGRVRFARVRTSLAGLVWKVAGETAPATNHLIQLDQLRPDSEYVVAVECAEDAAFTEPRMLGYAGFSTKLSYPRVKVESPEEREEVGGTVRVVVKAGDPVKRFTDNGLVRVELIYFSGGYLARASPGPEYPALAFFGPPDHKPGTDRYVFKVDTRKLGRGFHCLDARVQDEFSHRSDCLRTILVKGR